MSAAGALGGSLLLGATAVDIASWMYFSTWLGALAEEVLFRKALPGYLERCIAGTPGVTVRLRITAVLLAQCAFAIAHQLSALSRMSYHSWEDSLRLIAAGIGYSTLATFGGLWLAVASHTAFNFDLLSDVFRPRADGQVLIAWIVVFGGLTSHAWWRVKAG